MIAELDASDVGQRNQLLHQLARKFENDLIGVEAMPDDYVHVLVHVLSSVELTRYAGAAQFALNAYLDSDKMTEGQRRRVLDVIRDNFEKYQSEELSLVATDFIARRFPTAVALDALVDIGSRATLAGIQSVQVGLDSLCQVENFDAALLEKVQQARRALDQLERDKGAGRI